MSNKDYYVLSGNPQLISDIFSGYTPRHETPHIAIYEYDNHPMTFYKFNGKVLSRKNDVLARIVEEHDSRNLNVNLDLVDSRKNHGNRT
jgi:hypothetical protein